jgi:hypothetical protein
LENSTLLLYRKGRHGKTFCLLRQREVAQEALAVTLDMKPESRTLASITDKINITVIPSYNNQIEGGISEATVRNYMISWGFSFKERQKDVYVDGHESGLITVMIFFIFIITIIIHGAINYCKILHPGCKLSAKYYRAGFNIFKNRKLFNFLTFFFFL